MDVKLTVDILVVALPLLYAGVVAVYAVTFFGNSIPLERLKRPLLVALVLVHFVYLNLRTFAFEHPPITTVFEIITLLAASMSVAYLYIEYRTNVRNTGLFVLFLALIFQTVSSLFVKDLLVIPDYLHSLLLGFHVSTALPGYTARALSAVYGLLYLMLYYEIRSSRFGMVYNRLPNLETLEMMSNKAEVFGLVMLGVAILVGVFWLPVVFKEISYWDPKLVGTVTIWVLYAIVLGAKRNFGWQGRKTMIVALAGFGFVFLSMMVLNLYLSNFHSFK